MRVVLHGYELHGQRRHKMAARLKDKGLEELASFKRRVKRQGAMTRIARENETWLVERVEEIERYIAKMNELPDRESEYF